MRNVKLLQASDISILREALYKPYKSSSFSEDNYDEEAFLKKVATICLDNKHESALEHIVFTFDIKGIPRLTLMQLTRHRMASYTVESTRYTMPKSIEELKQDITVLESGDFDSKYEVASKYVVPCVDDMGLVSSLDSLYKDEELTKIEYLFDMECNTLCYFLKNFMEAREQGISLDDIKYLLPESWKTDLVCTMNLRSLINFMRLRLHKKAHREIRLLASCMHSILPQAYQKLVSYAYNMVDPEKEDNNKDNNKDNNNNKEVC